MVSESRDLTRFSETLPDLTEGDLIHLAAVRDGGDAGSLALARAAAVALSREIGVEDEAESLRGDLVHWAEGHGAVAGVWVGQGTQAPLVLVDLRRRAVPALADAAMALLLGERLGAEHRSVLLGPWEAVAETDSPVVRERET